MQNAHPARPTLHIGVVVVRALSDWLETRYGDVPETLRRRIEEAMNGGPECNVQGAGDATDKSIAPCTLRIAQLRSVAEELLSVVVKSGSDADPIDLLAADALITYACEAASECAPSALSELP